MGYDCEVLVYEMPSLLVMFLRFVGWLEGDLLGLGFVFGSVVGCLGFFVCGEFCLVLSVWVFWGNEFLSCNLSTDGGT